MFESFEEIIDYAVQKEIQAAEFYEEISGQEAFSGAKDTFASFAKEERKHQRMLENFGKENVSEYELKAIPDLKRSDYLVDIEYEPGMPYADILRLAMKREEKARAFYKDFARKTRDPDHQKLFEVLSQEEATHKLALETLLDDYLAELGD